MLKMTTSTLRWGLFKKWYSLRLARGTECSEYEYQVLCSLTISIGDDRADGKVDRRTPLTHLAVCAVGPGEIYQITSYCLMIRTKTTYLASRSHSQIYTLFTSWLSTIPLLSRQFQPSHQKIANVSGLLAPTAIGETIFNPKATR